MIETVHKTVKNESHTVVEGGPTGGLLTMTVICWGGLLSSRRGEQDGESSGVYGSLGPMRVDQGLRIGAVGACRSQATPWSDPTFLRKW